MPRLARLYSCKWRRQPSSFRCTKMDNLLNIYSQFVDELSVLNTQHSICFGPCGIHPIVAFICHFLDIAMDIANRDSTLLSVMTLLNLVTKAAPHVQTIVDLVLQFRTRLSRGIYDPTGFHDLRRALEAKEHLLAVRLFLFSFT